LRLAAARCCARRAAPGCAPARLRATACSGAVAARPALSARAARVAAQAQAQTLRRVGRGGLHEEDGEAGGGGGDGGGGAELLGVGARGEVGARPAALRDARPRALSDSSHAHAGCDRPASCSCELRTRPCT